MFVTAVVQRPSHEKGGIMSNNNHDEVLRQEVQKRFDEAKARGDRDEMKRQLNNQVAIEERRRQQGKQ